MGSVQQSLNSGVGARMCAERRAGEERPPGSKAPRPEAHTQRNRWDTSCQAQVARASSLLPAAAGAGRALSSLQGGGRREEGEEGKGERELPRMLNIPLPFGKPQPQSRRAAASARRQLRVRPARGRRSAAMATSPQKSPSVPKSPTPPSPPSEER